MTPSIQLKIFVLIAAVLLLSGVKKCRADDEETQETQTDDGMSFFDIFGGNPAIENDVSGRWYAVMSTACQDGEPCNIFANNVGPCSCISAFFLSLQGEGWEVFMSAINSETDELTIDFGGVSGTSDNNSIIKGFILSRIIMPTSVIAGSDNFITEKVSGSGYFYTFEMSIIGQGKDFFYIVTKMKTENSPEIIVIWSRNRAPGKMATWTQVLETLKELDINPHDLSFISQEDCKYPTIEQCNEMFFCASQKTISI